MSRDRIGHLERSGAWPGPLERAPAAPSVRQVARSAFRLAMSLTRPRAARPCTMFDRWEILVGPHRFFASSLVARRGEATGIDGDRRSVGVLLCRTWSALGSGSCGAMRAPSSDEWLPARPSRSPIAGDQSPCCCDRCPPVLPDWSARASCGERRATSSTSRPSVSPGMPPRRRGACRRGGLSERAVPG